MGIWRRCLVSRQYFRCLSPGFGLDDHCLGLGLVLALAVLVVCHETAQDT